MQKLAQTASAAADRRAADILQLIADFQRAAKVVVGSLKRQFESPNPLGAWHAGKIPRSGSLLQPKGKYSFHGIGCHFEVTKRIVEVDFGPGGRCDGFDAWRLQQYAASAFEWREVSAEQIERGLRDAEGSGLIKSPRWEPTPHLYYFSEDLDAQVPLDQRRLKRIRAGK